MAVKLLLYRLKLGDKCCKLWCGMLQVNDFQKDLFNNDGVFGESISVPHVEHTFIIY